MKTFHKVITKISERRSGIVYAGEVYADELPKSTCEETNKYDLYEDFFHTKEEAMLFIRTQKRYL